MSKLTPACVILGTFGLIMTAPIMFGFTYPTHGDDGANYLAVVLDGEPMHNYGILLLKPLMWYFTPLQAISFLYYTILLVSVIMVYSTLSRYSQTAAIIGTPLMMLGNWAVWRLWFEGSVIGLGGIMIFNLGAYLCLSRYLEKKSWIWLAAFLTILIAGMLFHKGTGLYILLTAGVLAVLYRDLILGYFTAFLAIVGGFLWHGDNDLINATLQSFGVFDIAKLMALSGILVLSYKHWWPRFKDLSALTRILFVLLLIMFSTLLIYNPYKYRVQIDMSIIMFILFAVLIGKGITYIPNQYRSYAVMLMIFFPLMSNADKWLTDYQPVQQRDMVAIQEVNRLAEQKGSLLVATSWGERESVLRFYFNDRVRITHDLDEAEIVIIRQQKRSYFDLRGVNNESYTTISCRDYEKLGSMDGNTIYKAKGE